MRIELCRLLLLGLGSGIFTSKTIDDDASKAPFGLDLATGGLQVIDYGVWLVDFHPSQPRTPSYFPKHNPKPSFRAFTDDVVEFGHYIGLFLRGIRRASFRESLAARPSGVTGAAGSV